MSKQIATNRPKRGIPTERRAARQKTQRDGSRPRRVRSLVAPTRVRVVGALIVGLVFGLFLSSGLRTVIAESRETAHRWEYARFTFAQADVTWSTPDHHYVAEGLDDLYRYIADREPQGHITSVGIANLIGSRGWELESVSYSTDPRGRDSYWFKRPVD